MTQDKRFSTARQRLFELTLRKQGHAVPERSRIERRPSAEGPCLTSYGQRWIWHLAHQEGASAAHQQSTALKFVGELNVEALRRAFDAIVARHEVLRTVYRKEGNEVWQEIERERRFDLRTVDLSATAGAEQESALAEHLAEEAARAIELARGPVMRGVLYTLNEREHILQLTVHQIAYDGWSKGVLARDFHAFYVAFRDGRDPTLPPLDVQFADYARWERATLSGEYLESGLSHWRKRLAGAPPLLQLPTDRPRPARPSWQSAEMWGTFPADAIAEVRAFAANHNLTLYQSLLVAWALLFARLSGQRDFVLGTLVANRRHVEVESTIGFFINYAPLRVQLHDNQTMAGLAEQIREGALSAQAHQWVPFAEIVRDAGLEGERAYAPIFQTTLMLDNTPLNSGELPVLDVTPYPAPPAGAVFDLAISMNERSRERVDYQMLYAQDLFVRSTMETWVESLAGIMRAMVNQRDLPISALIRRSE